MVTHSQPSSSPSRQRLNPFAFPSDTDFRFVILVVAVLSAALFIYQNLYFALPSNSGSSTAAPLQCSQCVIQANRLEAAWIGLSIMLLLSVAGVIYWAFPAWKIWRGELKPLTAAYVPPEMIICLSDLCRKAGLARSPAFLLNAYSRTNSGLTFGHLGRYYVVLNSGLVLQFQRDRAAFCAVVFHELGHIRNADVDKTYFTLALGWAFALAALLPWVVALPFLHQNVADILNIGWRVLVLAIVIYLTIIAILRTREVYADVRASVWDGPVGALRRILETPSRPKGSLWQHLLRTHPELKERREALDDTSRLFRLRFWMAFTTGITASSAIVNVELILRLLHLGQTWDNVGATGIVFAFLIVGVVGIATWRATFAKLVQGKALPGILRISFGLTIGLLLGQTLSLFSAYTDSATDFGYFTDIGLLSPGQFTLTSFLNQAGSLILWSLLLLVLLVLFLRWVGVCAETWLEVAASNTSLRRTYWIGLIIAGGGLGICFALFYYLRTAIQLYTNSPLPTPVVGALALVAEPSTFFVFTCLWAYPLAAWFWQKRRSLLIRSSWAFLDPSTQSQAQAQSFVSSYHPPLRPGLALFVGLGGGLAFLGLLSFFTGRLQLPFDFLYQLALAVSLQIAMATIVSAWIPHLSAIHGLFTAFVVGCIATAVILAHMHTFDFTKALLVVNTGMLATLPVVLLVSTLARWVRRLGQGNVPTNAVRSPGLVRPQ